MSDEPVATPPLPAEEDEPTIPANEDLSMPEPEYVGDHSESGDENGLPDSAVEGEEEPSDDDEAEAD